MRDLKADPHYPNARMIDDPLWYTMQTGVDGESSDAC